MDLENRTIVVTGASRGIGRALAERLARAGANGAARSWSSRATSSARTFAGGALYTASKHAQRAFARALQMEEAESGVRATEVRPGSVSTCFADATPRPAGDDLLAADDVADAIVYALARPGRVRLDEIHVHPRGQATGF